MYVLVILLFAIAALVLPGLLLYCIWGCYKKYINKDASFRTLIARKPKGRRITSLQQLNSAEAKRKWVQLNTNADDTSLREMVGIISQKLDTLTEVKSSSLSSNIMKWLQDGYEEEKENDCA